MGPTQTEIGRKVTARAPTADNLSDLEHAYFMTRGLVTETTHSLHTRTHYSPNRQGQKDRVCEIED